MKNKAKCVNPFAGLVSCQCGYIMTMRTYKNKKKKKRADDRLLCTNQAECGTASCTTDEMHRVVVKILQDAIADFDLRIEHSADDSIELHRRLIDQHEKRLEELNQLELSQWDKYTQEGMPKHIFDQLNAKVLAEREEIQQALCTMRDTLPEPIDYAQKRATFHAALKCLQDPDATALEKNILLKQCIDHIVYARKRKGSGNRRWGDPEPMELDVHLRV